MAKDSSEGAILAWGILIVVVCVAGSIITRINLVDFFFILVFIIASAAILVGLMLGGIAIFIYAFRRQPGDNRTILQILKHEYNTNKLISSYRLLFKLVGEYLSESQTYIYVKDVTKSYLRATIWSLRHPKRALKRDWDHDREL